MNILITNDDGIDAAQLIPLIRWCKKLGDVTVVVPKVEQSAKSHSIEIRSPFEIKKVQLAEDITAWSVDSSPADCVRFAVSGLQKHYDLAISGINRGYNLGKDILYSGTMAAASEACNKGIPALAMSASMKYYDKAVDHLDEIIAFIDRHNLFQYGMLYNINIPVDPKGILITKQGGLSFREEFVPIGNDLYFPGGKPLRATGDDPNLDTDAAALGYISVTPITTDRTDYSIYHKLTQFNL